MSIDSADIHCIKFRADICFNDPRVDQPAFQGASAKFSTTEALLTERPDVLRLSLCEHHRRNRPHAGNCC